MDSVFTVKSSKVIAPIFLCAWYCAQLYYYYIVFGSIVVAFVGQMCNTVLLDYLLYVDTK